MICFIADDPKALFNMLREAVKCENSGFSLNSLPPDPERLFSPVKNGDHIAVKRMCVGNKSLVWTLSSFPAHIHTHARTQARTHAHTHTHTHTSKHY